MVERLSRQWCRTIAPCRPHACVGNPRAHLDQAVIAPATLPRPAPAIGVQADVDQPGIELAPARRTKPEAGKGIGPIAVNEYVRSREQPFQRMQIIRVFQVEPGTAFEAGVRHGYGRDDITAELFSVRARFLLGKARREDSASYASGLLIGADLKTGLSLAGDAEPVVMGRPELTRLYAAGLAACGRSGREADGEDAFLAGARKLAELLT